MDDDGWGDILEVPVANNRSWSHWCFGSSTRGPLLPETGRMNITDLLVQGTGSGGAFCGDPGIPHGTLSIVVCVFKLMEIKVDPLESLFFPVAALQPV